jgi:hypothetical protein
VECGAAQVYACVADGLGREVVVLREGDAVADFGGLGGGELVGGEVLDDEGEVGEGLGAKVIS